ncbi:hypothetical protein NM688_g4750 [Phlebia brevispora]|uniref:Uncharacterized protein n=1 Tax=Phlebia brevispora TaxID=194682 RepID=A0ACC1T252_9APHY|nr:hypothetical protein NM688_g4750 [Phlebia brevispora]
MSSHPTTSSFEMSDETSLAPAEYVEIARTLLATKIYSVAACVMLFYDICITFGDEVEKIWKRRFTGATVLWFMNRYLNPLGYIVIIVSFHQRWPTSVCNRYVHYPEILKTITDTAIGLVFILRLYAIYSRSRIILFTFSALLLAEIGIKIWSFTDGVALQLPPGNCFVMHPIFRVSSLARISRVHTDRKIIEIEKDGCFSITHQSTDSCVFFATLLKALSIYRNLSNHSAALIRIILRDGVVYFATIFAANLLTVVFLLAASPDLKPINATFGNMLTSLMVSRLMLNLRLDVDSEEQAVGGRTTLVRDASPRVPGVKKFEDTIIGNLGQDIH